MNDIPEWAKILLFIFGGIVFASIIALFAVGPIALCFATQNWKPALLYIPIVGAVAGFLTYLEA